MITGSVSGCKLLDDLFGKKTVITDDNGGGGGDVSIKPWVMEKTAELAKSVQLCYKLTRDMYGPVSYCYSTNGPAIGSPDGYGYYTLPLTDSGWTGTTTVKFYTTHSQRILSRALLQEQPGLPQ
jgi:hypothetical protein